MIVGGYSLHLYCDSERECKAIRESWMTPTFGEFEGTNEADCNRQAKRRGWKIRNGKCFCPLCSK